MPSAVLSHFHSLETSSRVLEEKANIERIGQKEEVQAAISDMDPPALSLPVEVTSLVFRYLMGSNDQLAIEPYFPPSLKSRKPGFLMDSEVILSHVCRLWRSIALNLPILWTTYRYDSYIFYPPGPSLHRLEAYLERSRSHLVDLKFDFRIAQGYSHYDCGSRLQMVAKIMAHVTQWRRVFIIADKNTPILDLLDNFKMASAPNLEHFSLRMGCYGATTRQVQDLQPVLFKGGAPKLSSVAVDYLNHLVLSPLSNITTLRIEQPKLNTKWELLSSDAFINILLIPTLTNLSLVGDIGVLVYVEDFEDIIPMRSLKHLRLADSWSMSTILPYLRAPLLETLIIRNWYPEGYSTPDYNYSFPSLHTLAFEQSPDYEYPELVSWDSDYIFRSLSILTKHAVYIAFSHFSSLERAFLFPRHQAFWPDLQVINFNVKYSTRIDDYLIFATARASRKKPRFVLRIHEELMYRWHVEAPNALRDLERACFVEPMATGAMSAALISNRSWPPTFDDAIPDDDFLEIDADDHLNLQRDIYHSQIRPTWKCEVF